MPKRKGFFAARQRGVDDSPSSQSTNKDDPRPQRARLGFFSRSSNRGNDGSPSQSQRRQSRSSPVRSVWGTFGGRNHESLSSQHTNKDDLPPPSQIHRLMQFFRPSQKRIFPIPASKMDNIIRIFDKFNFQSQIVKGNPGGSESRSDNTRSHDTQSNQSNSVSGSGSGRRRHSRRSATDSLHSHSSASIHSNQSFTDGRDHATHLSLNEILRQERSSNTPWKIGTFAGSDIVSVTEDVHTITDRWDQMMGKEIQAGETYNQRFETLRDQRYVKVSETSQTQPFVNGVLREFFKIYLAKYYPQDHLAVIDDATESMRQYLSNSSLYLYCDQKVDEGDETKPTTEEKRFHVETNTRELSRIPDAAFFRRGTQIESKEVEFDKAALKCALVSVEAKRNLCPESILDALLECQRDHAHVSFNYPSNQMRVGFSIITDGVDWYFLYIQWNLREPQQEWKQTIHASPKIDFESNKEELAKWLLFILQLSLTGPKLPTDFQDEIDQFSLTAILQVGTRSAVYLWKDSVGEYFVLKHFQDQFGFDFQKFRSRELKFLKNLARKSNIVNLLNVTPTVDRGFWLEYGGTPLEYLDISGRRGQQLAVIVKRDMWDGALSALIEKRICHGDIHQSNVVICLKTSKATLIDFESAKEFGKDLQDSPIRHQFYRYKIAQKEVDKISVAALLYYLWNPLKTHFEGLKEYKTCLKNDKAENERYNIVAEIRDAITNRHAEHNEGTDDRAVEY